MKRDIEERERYKDRENECQRDRARDRWIDIAKESEMERYSHFYIKRRPVAGRGGKLKKG